MAREASLMSVSPWQKSLKPSPVPGPSTLIATSGFVALNASLTASEIGWTVDEPEMVISPPRAVDGAAADDGGELSALGFVAGMLLQAPIATTDASASPAMRVKRGMVTR